MKSDDLEAVGIHGLAVACMLVILLAVSLL